MEVYKAENQSLRDKLQQQLFESKERQPPPLPLPQVVVMVRMIIAAPRKAHAVAIQILKS